MKKSATNKQANEQKWEKNAHVFRIEIPNISSIRSRAVLSHAASMWPSAHEEMQLSVVQAKVNIEYAKVYVC